MKKRVDNNIAMLFFDVIYDAQYLKYIYEYGFDWDDNISRMLIGEGNGVGTQKIRELCRLLTNDDTSSRLTVEWNEDSKSKRRVIRKNLYSLTDKNWFFYVFSKYGVTTDAVNKSVNNCSYRYGADTICENKCSKKHRCKILCQRSIIEQLFFGISSSERLENRIIDDFISEYKEMIDNSGRKFYLMDNNWGFQHLKQDNLVDSIESYSSIIEFFAVMKLIAPLGILGDSISRKLSGGHAESVFLVRNIPKNIWIEQEVIHRVVYAVRNNRYLKLFNSQKDSEEYIAPIKLEYSRKNIYGIDCDVILTGIDTNQNIIRIVINDGCYLNVSDEKFDAGISVEKDIFHEEQQCGKVVHIVVSFIYNGDTDYIRNKVDGYWSRYKKSSKVIQNRFVNTRISPYYSTPRNWHEEIAEYEINTTDIEGFMEYIDSFGEFAFVHEEQSMSGKKDKSQPIYRSIIGSRRKGTDSGIQSMLNIFSSSETIDYCRNKDDSKTLPFSIIEFEWIEFVLKKYANLAHVFLSDSLYKDLLERAELNNNILLNSNILDYGNRLCDIDQHTVDKYMTIYHAIKNKDILRYEYGNKQCEIIPYAFEYDLINHMAGRNGEPYKIMCYDLQQKRNIVVDYKNIRVKNSQPYKNRYFSAAEKLYHIAAYCSRAAYFEEDNIDTGILAIVELFYRKDNRGDNSYVRCIKKKYGKNSKSLHTVFSEINFDLKRSSCDSDGSEAQDCICGFRQYCICIMNDIFQYYCANDKENQINPTLENYIKSVLDIMNNAIKIILGEKSKPQKSMEIIKIILDFPDEDIWNLILGEKYEDRMTNEIIFFNEHLKNSKVSFQLKSDIQDVKAVIEHIYELFSPYTVKGKLIDGVFSFDVFYEEFSYRKIHMLLLVIYEYIDKITPDSIQSIIEKRICAKRRLLNNEI